LPACGKRQTVEATGASLEFEAANPQLRHMADTLHLVCSHCSSVNRVPRERLGDNPKCGQCKQSVLTGHPVELTGVNFRKHLASNDLPLVVDFWAPWCGPCIAMAPEFSAAAESLVPEARLFKLNTDAESAIAGEFAIRSIPTLILFKGGREVARHSGTMGRADIVRWLRSGLAP
jgi:thioredoxin 2